MNRKATSIAALVAAAAVAVTPISGAVAATSAPAAVVAPTAATPTAVLKSAGTAPTALASAIQSGSVGSFVVVTEDAVKAAPAALAGAPAPTVQTAAAASPIALPSVPQSVTDVLNLAGLPVANVFGVVQIAQGVYSVWYKLLSSVPQAIQKGDFGSVPTLLQKAVSDSLTWITTGAGPVKPPAPAALAAASGTTAVPASVLTNALNVVGIPFSTGYAAMVAGQSIYSSFYGLLSKVPNAILQGKFGDVPTLVLDAINKSVATVTGFPGGQIQSASDKVTKLIDGLKTAAPTTTSAPATSSDTTKALAVTSAPETAVTSRTAADTVTAVAAQPTAPVNEPVVDKGVKAEAKAPVTAETAKVEAPAEKAKDEASAEKTKTEAPAEKAKADTPAENAEAPAKEVNEKTEKTEKATASDTEKSAGSDKDSSSK